MRLFSQTLHLAKLFFDWPFTHCAHTRQSRKGKESLEIKIKAEMNSPWKEFIMYVDKLGRWERSKYRLPFFYCWYRDKMTGLKQTKLFGLDSLNLSQNGWHLIKCFCINKDEKGIKEWKTFSVSEIHPKSFLSFVMQALISTSRRAFMNGPTFCKVSETRIDLSWRHRVFRLRHFLGKQTQEAHKKQSL